LSEAEVLAVLAEVQCNDAIKERVGKAEYANADALKAAVVAEVEYLKRVTGAGRVTDLGETAKPKQVTLAEVEERRRAANAKWGFGPRQLEKKENQK
jgi:hypothetical protein